MRNTHSHTHVEFCDYCIIISLQFAICYPNNSIQYSQCNILYIHYIAYRFSEKHEQIISFFLSYCCYCCCCYLPLFLYFIIISPADTPVLLIIIFIVCSPLLLLLWQSIFWNLFYFI